MHDGESPLKFPCTFPIKVLGLKHQRFVQNILDVVLRYAPDFPAETVELRASSGGKYLSVTCTIEAVSQDQLNNLYTALKGHPDVAVVL
jgi:putative lipoic acid-binding regulatory protein